MIRREKLFHVLGLTQRDRGALEQLASMTGLSREYLNYLEKSDKLPSSSDLASICRTLKLPLQAVKLRLGFIDQSLLDDLSKRANQVVGESGSEPAPPKPPKQLKPKFSTELGTIFQADCVEFMRTRPADHFDLIFADPPFNLNKEYPSGMDDSLLDEDYLL